MKKIMELSEKIQELSEKVKLLEVQLVAKQDKGLKHSDLNTNQTVNLLTGIPSKPAFDKLFDSVKGSIKKVNIGVALRKHPEKAGTLGNHQKNLDQNGLFLKRTSFF